MGIIFKSEMILKCAMVISYYLKNKNRERLNGFLVPGISVIFQKKLLCFRSLGIRPPDGVKSTFFPSSSNFSIVKLVIILYKSQEKIHL